jgi:CyaY protein
MSDSPRDFVDDSAFRLGVSQALRALLDQVDAIDSDALESRLTEGNLQISFEAGGVFVLSQQTPTHELWLSANLRAWHFRRQGGRWLERDTREPMDSLLSGLIGGKLGQLVDLRL